MSDVKVTKSRLKELERSEAVLNALEAAGVDNWGGYCDALDEIRKADDIEDLIINTLDSISDAVGDNIDVECEEFGNIVTISSEGDDALEDIIRELLVKYTNLKEEE